MRRRPPRSTLLPYTTRCRSDQISKQHGPQILFVEASAAVHRGEKVGLVGTNGAGKSTVFRLIIDRKSTRLNSSHANISYAVFCLKTKQTRSTHYTTPCPRTT